MFLCVKSTQRTIIIWQLHQQNKKKKQTKHQTQPQYEQEKREQKMSHDQILI